MGTKTIPHRSHYGSTQYETAATTDKFLHNLFLLLLPFFIGPYPDITDLNNIWYIKILGMRIGTIKNLQRKTFDNT